MGKIDWSAWTKERQSFDERESQGFNSDLAALKAHIDKLTEVCPKDKGGWPHIVALRHLDTLKANYARWDNWRRVSVPVETAH